MRRAEEREGRIEPEKMGKIFFLFYLYFVFFFCGRTDEAKRKVSSLAKVWRIIITSEISDEEKKKENNKIEKENVKGKKKHLQHRAHCPDLINLVSSLTNESRSTWFSSQTLLFFHRWLSLSLRRRHTKRDSSIDLSLSNSTASGAISTSILFDSFSQLFDLFIFFLLSLF